MDMVAALKAFGVVLAGVVAWLALAATVLEVLFRVMGPRSQQPPAAAGSSASQFEDAPVAMRSTAQRRHHSR